MSDLVSFQKDIRTNNLKPFYILYGEEIGLMNVYLNQMGNVVRESLVSTVWKTLLKKGSFLIVEYLLFEMIKTF